MGFAHFFAEWNPPRMMLSGLLDYLKSGVFDSGTESLEPALPTANSLQVLKVLHQDSPVGRPE